MDASSVSNHSDDGFIHAPKPPTDSSELIPRESLVDLAAERLRAAILSSELGPLDRIRVPELERRFGISHIPIREAIRRLEGEGLITSEPRRTPRVAPLALADFAAVLDLRCLIEIPAARRSAEASTIDQRAALHAAFDALRRAVDDNRSEGFWEAHRRFHWLLIAPGANSWTRRVLEPLWTENERYVRLYVTAHESAEETVEQHASLIEACDARDPDLLEDRIRYHLSVRGRWPMDGADIV